jgi:hypothetical protein
MKAVGGREYFEGDVTKKKDPKGGVHVDPLGDVGRESSRGSVHLQRNHKYLIQLDFLATSPARPGAERFLAARLSRAKRTRQTADRDRVSGDSAPIFAT